MTNVSRYKYHIGCNQWVRAHWLWNSVNSVLNLNLSMQTSLVSIGAVLVHVSLDYNVVTAKVKVRLVSCFMFSMLKVGHDSNCYTWSYNCYIPATVSSAIDSERMVGCGLNMSWSTSTSNILFYMNNPFKECKDTYIMSGVVIPEEALGLKVSLLSMWRQRVWVPSCFTSV